MPKTRKGSVESGMATASKNGAVRLTTMPAPTARWSTRSAGVPTLGAVSRVMAHVSGATVGAHEYSAQLRGQE